MTPYEYVAAELSTHADEIKEMLELPSTNPDVLFDRIIAASNGRHGLVRDNTTGFYSGKETLKDWLFAGLPPQEEAPSMPQAQTGAQEVQAATATHTSKFRPAKDAGDSFMAKVKEAKKPAKAKTAAAAIDIVALKEKIRGYFVEEDGTKISLGDIAIIGDIDSTRAVGALLGKGGNVTFSKEQLEEYGRSLEEWVKENNPKRSIRYLEFADDWQQLSKYILEQQKRGAQR